MRVGTKEILKDSKKVNQIDWEMLWVDKTFTLNDIPLLLKGKSIQNLGPWMILMEMSFLVFGGCTESCG